MFSILALVSAVATTQACLFDALNDSEPATFDRGFSQLRRIGLKKENGRAAAFGGGSPIPAWVDYAPGWLRGHKRTFEDLRDRAEWRSEQREMYERVVSVPRLLAPAPESGEAGRLIAEVSRALSARYQLNLTAVTMALYRDGNDSVAMHGDKMRALSHDTVVATVSLGAPRRFVMKPVSGGRVRAFHLGWGDLLVMGGSCQQTWLHGVPKVRRADPRVSIMFRPANPR